MVVLGTLTGQFSTSSGQLPDPLGSQRVGSLALPSLTTAAYNITDSVGNQIIQVSTQLGGNVVLTGVIATGSLGTAGGSVNLNGNSGSFGTTGASPVAGGAGGGTNMQAGTGGSGTASGVAAQGSPGGVGGPVTLTAGLGGAAVAAVGPGAGGAGGNVTITAGLGANGAQTSVGGQLAGNAGAGGTLALVGGTGGQGTTAGSISNSPDGAGGNITITGGSAGTATAAGANGGSVTISGGAPHGTGVSGTVTLAGSAINVGTAGVPVAISAANSTTSVVGNLSLGQREIVAAAAVGTPTSLGSSQNNYSPNVNSLVILQDASAAVNITGWLAPSPGENRIFYFVNISAANNITFTNQDASSSAGNRIACPGAASVVVRPSGSVVFFYDNARTVWRILSGLI